MLHRLTRLGKGRTRRFSSYDVTGGNADCWAIQPGEARVLADIQGPGAITRLWMGQWRHYRECLLRITWDNARRPSVLAPLGDFFGLGHGIVNSYQSLLFSASTRHNNQFNDECSLNSYVRMPFRERALVELINESRETHGQYFHVDYESHDGPPADDLLYLHAEFRRENPFGGWGPELPVSPRVANKERLAWRNNYVILETRGRGHYIGCNLSVTNFKGQWWGEGDDMIWVDGYKWPPDLHGTGSEEYFGQAWGMHDNAFLRSGSSIWEGHTISHRPTARLAPWDVGGYQTCYVQHIENPVRFTKEIKVTIEHGHANHLCNEMSSVAYWYADQPAAAVKVPPVEKRMPVLRDNMGNWLFDKKNQVTSRVIEPNAEMRAAKKQWKEKQAGK